LEESHWVNNGRRAQFLAWLVGVVIFIESNITVLVAGSVSRPLFDRYKVSREKLAYLIDSTSAAVCILIPLNAWGAYNLGILGELGVESPLSVFLESIPLNLYAIFAVLLSLSVVIWGVDIGPMKKAEQRTREGELLWPDSTPMIDESVLSPEPTDKIPPRAYNMFLPIVIMVLMMPVGLYITGGGDLREGSGSTSVLWAVSVGLVSAWILLKAQGAFSVDELVKLALRGAAGLLPLALILLLALSIGDVAARLGTGVYVANVTAGVLPPVIFLPRSSWSRASWPSPPEPVGAPSPSCCPSRCRLPPRSDFPWPPSWPRPSPVGFSGTTRPRSATRRSCPPWLPPRTTSITSAPSSRMLSSRAGRASWALP
jgi:Na+/H+ antiporter NhaC